VEYSTKVTNQVAQACKNSLAHAFCGLHLNTQLHTKAGKVEVQEGDLSPLREGNRACAPHKHDVHNES
jgi:hypothetical protein